jgi:hypothetical protein
MFRIAVVACAGLAVYLVSASASADDPGSAVGTVFAQTITEAAAQSTLVTLPTSVNDGFLFVTENPDGGVTLPDAGVCFSDILIFYDPSSDGGDTLPGAGDAGQGIVNHVCIISDNDSNKSGCVSNLAIASAPAQGCTGLNGQTVAGLMARAASATEVTIPEGTVTLPDGGTSETTEYNAMSGAGTTIYTLVGAAQATPVPSLPPWGALLLAGGLSAAAYFSRRGTRLA